MGKFESRGPKLYWELFTGPKLPNCTRESAEISYFVGSCSLLYCLNQGYSRDIINEVIVGI